MAEAPNMPHSEVVTLPVSNAPAGANNARSARGGSGRGGAPCSASRTIERDRPGAFLRGSAVRPRADRRFRTLSSKLVPRMT